MILRFFSRLCIVGDDTTRVFAWRYIHRVSIAKLYRNISLRGGVERTACVVCYRLHYYFVEHDSLVIRFPPVAFVTCILTQVTSSCTISNDSPYPARASGIIASSTHPRVSSTHPRVRGYQPATFLCCRKHAGADRGCPRQRCCSCP